MCSLFPSPENAEAPAAAQLAFKHPQRGERHESRAGSDLLFQFFFLTALEFAQPWDHRDQVTREYLQGEVVENRHFPNPGLSG